MHDKPTVIRGSFSFIGSTLVLLLTCAFGLHSRSAYALVGGQGPDLIPIFTQNLGGGSSPTSIQAPILTNVVPSTPLGTAVTFDPSWSYLPESPNPNQTYLYLVTWDFGDPSPNIFQPSAVPLPATPANLAILLRPVTHIYTNEGIYTPNNSGIPTNGNTPPPSAYLGPKLTIQIFVQTNIVVNGTGTSGSAVLTGITSTTGVAASATVSGVGVPANTTVLTFTATTITLSQNVTITSTGPFTISVVTPGTSNFTTGSVQISNANQAPKPSIQNIGSAPSANGVPLTVTVSNSYDSDGYVLWAAIDWGDGIFELVRQQPPPAQAANVVQPLFVPLLPNPLPPPPNGFDLPGIPTSHLYSAPGTYKVTLTIIDNGRLIPNPTTPVPNPNPPPANLSVPLPFPLPVVPPPNDPFGALASIKAFYQQTTGFGAEAVPNHRFDPQLAQDFFFVQVSGSLTAAASQFTVDFTKTNADKLTLTEQLTSDTAVDTFNSVPIAISLGTKTGTSVALPTFTTDSKGTFKSSQINFKFDPRKRIVKLDLKSANIRTSLGLSNQTITNGSVDAKVTIAVGANAPIVTFVRYQYKAQTGTKGIGKNGHAIPGGASN